MCDHSNAQTIVEELLQYLEKADYSIRETLVGKGVGEVGRNKACFCLSGVGWKT